MTHVGWSPERVPKREVATADRHLDRVRSFRKKCHTEQRKAILCRRVWKIRDHIWGGHTGRNIRPVPQSPVGEPVLSLFPVDELCQRGVEDFISLFVRGFCSVWTSRVPSSLTPSWRVFGGPPQCL